ncbi:hypothetical protein SESBI_45959 [Sesbania bispinosa]|nr:hypothetical protein SESBI_45959 [Sesbania bispinosa]
MEYHVYLLIPTISTSTTATVLFFLHHSCQSQPFGAQPPSTSIEERGREMLQEALSRVVKLRKVQMMRVRCSGYNFLGINGGRIDACLQLFSSQLLLLRILVCFCVFLVTRFRLMMKELSAFVCHSPFVVFILREERDGGGGRTNLRQTCLHI